MNLPVILCACLLFPSVIAPYPPNQESKNPEESESEDQLLGDSLFDYEPSSVDFKNLGVSLSSEHTLGESLMSVPGRTTNGSIDFRDLGQSFASMNDSCHLTSTPLKEAGVLSESASTETMIPKTSRSGLRFTTSTPMKNTKEVEIATTEFDVLECSSIVGSSTSSEEQFNVSFESSFENTWSLDTHIVRRKSKYTGKSLSRQQNLLKKAISTAVNCLIRSRSCKLSCLSGITTDFVKRVRTKVWTRNFEGRVEWFSDKYSEATNKEKSIRFTVDDGRQICSKCFQNLYRLDKSFYYKHIANFEKGAVSAGYQNVKEHHTTTEKAIEWINDYASFHGDQMPDKGVILLAYKTRKIDIYNQYVDEETEQMQRSVSKSNFYKIWQEKFPHLKIKQTNSFSKCNTCTKLDAQLQATRDPIERDEIKGLIKAHNYRQMMERKYYYSKRTQAKENKQRYMSIIIDGMDQMKTNLPHFLGRRSNDLDMANLLSTHIQGVINHGLETFTKYLDMNEYAHDSNMVINTILKELHGTSVQMSNFLPPTLYVQADNCFRENKNRYTLGFCELLIWKNIFREVHLSFLFVGHTHEDIDAGFSKIADKLRRNEAGTITRLLSLIPNTRQLRGLYDIKTWLTPYLNPVSHHTKPHHYRFYRNHENRVIAEYKGSHNSHWKQLPSTILKQIPTGIPKILKPQNFHKLNIDGLEKNIDRAKFLFSDQTQFQWWKRFLSYLKDLKADTDEQLKYAKEQARWLLPLLPKQQEGSNSDGSTQPSRIDPELHEMVDKELDEPQVQMQVKRTNPTINTGRNDVTGSTNTETDHTTTKRSSGSGEKQVKSKKTKLRKVRTVYQAFVYYFRITEIYKHECNNLLLYLIHAVYTLYAILIILLLFVWHYDILIFILLWDYVIRSHIYNTAHICISFLNEVFVLIVRRESISFGV